ncbi:MAG: molybdate ABC transporter substrate-binding protein [Nannocystales bacterium]
MPRLLPRSVVVLSLLLGGCGSEASKRVPLSVFAASSLTEAFTELEQTFEREHPSIDVRLSFAGSHVLRLQIEQGAAADVFASADPEQMEALDERGRLESHAVFAHNELVVVVPGDNPAGIHRFDDLEQARRIVLGSAAVPAGRYADAVLDRSDAVFSASVRAHVVSRESNVRLVRAKVELGEADAALVYRTDTVHTPSLRVTEIPAEVAVPVELPIGVLGDAPHGEAGRRFAQHVLSVPGQAVLATHGFLAGGR